MKKQLVEVNGILCEVIATYFDENTKKNYIIYTDKLKNNKGLSNVYFGLYDIVDHEFVLRKINSDEDRRIVSNMFR